jgi:phosphate transport system substrate-binding protein
VKTWNDAAIQKLNANVKLPNQAIAIVHRSDGSGTSYNLSEVSPDWKTKVGSKHRRRMARRPRRQG